MSLTFSEKVISNKLGETVRAGQLAFVPVDKVMTNEMSGFVAIKQFERYNLGQVFDPDRIILVPDHNVPNKDVTTAGHATALRKFAQKHNIPHYYEVGEMGIEHVLLPEKGLVLPGELILGADSHTCTYGALGAFSCGMGSTDIAAAMATGKTWLRVPETIKVDFVGRLPKYITGKDLILTLIGKIGVAGALYQTLEIGGEAIESLNMDERLTICNMAVEAGAKNGVIFADEITRQYLAERGIGDGYKIFKSDPDSNYAGQVTIDVSEMRPVVAAPFSPDNVILASEAGKKPVDQVVIGACTNGRLTDFRQAAELLGDKKIARGVRVIILPGSQDVYLQALQEGIIEKFIKAGAAVSTPTCGPCAGLHTGVLDAKEVAVSTTNRNFVGRMGHTTSEVYLASPYVAAASALTGYITCPWEVE